MSLTPVIDTLRKGRYIHIGKLLVWNFGVDDAATIAMVTTCSSSLATLFLTSSVSPALHGKKQIFLVIVAYRVQFYMTPTLMLYNDKLAVIFAWQTLALSATVTGSSSCAYNYPPSVIPYMWNNIKIDPPNGTATTTT